MIISDDSAQNLDLQNVNQYDILLCFAADGLTIFITDQSKTLLSTRSFPFDGFYTANAQEIIQLLMGVSEMKLNFNNVRVVCESERYTFVPVPFFKAEEAELFLSYQQLITEKEVALYNVLANLATVNVFSLAKGLQAALTQLFPQCTVEHQQSYFLTEKVTFTPENSMQVWVRDKVMDVVVLMNGNLQLINSYSYSSAEDFVYYILLIYEQLSLNMETDRLQLYNMKKREKMGQLIENYVKNVSCVS